MNKLVPTKDRPLDCSTRHANCSVSRRQYEGACKRLRAQAKQEKRVLITNDGKEDYRNYVGPVEDAVEDEVKDEKKDMAVFKPVSHNVKFVKLRNGSVLNVDEIARLLPNMPNGVPGTITASSNFIEMRNGSTLHISDSEMKSLMERLDPKPL